MKSKPPEPGWCTAGVVRRVIDGDTLVVELRRVVHVRLLECWAPESRTTDPEEKQRGLAAKANMQQLAADKECLVFIPADAHGNLSHEFTMGRVLGYVYVDGRDLSEAQREAGHATATKEAA